MILYDLGKNSLAVIPRAGFQENHNKIWLDAIHRVVGVSLVSRKVTRQKDRLTALLAWRARIRRRTG